MMDFLSSDLHYIIMPPESLPWVFVGFFVDDVIISVYSHEYDQ